MPDLSWVDSWPAAFVVVAFIAAAMIAPALFTYLNNRLAKELRDETRAITHTLTEKNGGASVVDRFDHIDKMLRAQAKRLDALEERAKRHDAHWWQRGD